MVEFCHSSVARDKFKASPSHTKCFVRVSLIGIFTRCLVHLLNTVLPVNQPDNDYASPSLHSAFTCKAKWVDFGVKEEANEDKKKPGN